MKRLVLVGIFCGCTLLVGGTAALAAHPGGAFEKSGEPSFEQAPGYCPALWPHLLKRLDLSEEQERKIEKLLEGARERMDKLQAEMREVRRNLHRAMTPRQFDEKALRKLLAGQAAVEADLMVDKARTDSRIYGVLTLEQQELVDLAIKLRRLQGPPPGHPMPKEPEGRQPHE